MQATRVALCAIGLILYAGAAHAESWSIVEGQISLKKGKSSRLSGTFEASLSASDPEDAAAPVELRLDAFAFTAGRTELTPRNPVEYDGLVPVAWLQLADQIHVEGEQVNSLFLRSGGKLVDESAEEVTFRFLELRADASHGGTVLGRLGDTDLPRRLVLKGDVYQVDQSFGLPDASCEAPPPGGGSPGGGGSVVISNGALIDYGSFPVDAQAGTQVQAQGFGRRTLVWRDPTGGSVVVRGRTSGSASRIEGALYASSDTLLTPVGLPLEAVREDSLALDGPPSLEQLGIRAPAGATVSADASGAVRVSTTGDLFVDGVLPASPIPGLTKLSLSALGNIVITGRIDLPDGASLEIAAGGEVRIDTPDGIFPGEGDEIDDGGVGLPDFCEGLAPILPAAEKRVGRFSLIASAARQVKVDVRPSLLLGQKGKRIRPGSDQVISAVIFGSRSLDVYDIDRDGRSLGPAEAEPLNPSQRVFMGVNGDHYRDLVTDFAVRDTGIAFGDRGVCLVARTLDGELLEGCDRIETESSPAQSR